MDDRPDRYAPVPIHLCGATILALAAVHVAVDADGLVDELAEVVILLVFAGAVHLVGYQVGARGRTLREALRVVEFGLAGGVLVGSLSALFLAARFLSDETFPEFEFVLFIGWSLGLAAGTLSGYYYGLTRASVAAQRDLTKRLTVLQRVLRHNLRNEMTILGGASHDLRRLLDDPADESAPKLDVIDRHVERVTRLSEASATLTRIWGTGGTTSVDLPAVLRGEVERFREAYPDVPLDADVPDRRRISAHPDVGLAFREALRNAAVHNEDVEVALSMTGRAPDAPTVEIADTGSGIPASELRPLWGSGEGPLAHTTGLGLWTIYWLVEASAGDLDVETDATGTTLTMTFDRARG